MFDLYENIKTVARAHGYSPSGMCDAMGISKSTLSNLRNGRVDTLSYGTLRAIADFLGESYDLVAHGTIDESDDESARALDPEMLKLLEEIEDMVSLRELLYALKDATPTQICAVARMLDSFQQDC